MNVEILLLINVLPASRYVWVNYSYSLKSIEDLSMEDVKIGFIIKQWDVYWFKKLFTSFRLQTAVSMS